MSSVEEPTGPQHVIGHTIPWRKSTYSANDSFCVEVAPCPDGTIAARDSRAPDDGTLTFTTGWLGQLLRRIKEGRLDLPT